RVGAGGSLPGGEVVVELGGGDGAGEEVALAEVAAGHGHLLLADDVLGVQGGEHPFGEPPYRVLGGVLQHAGLLNSAMAQLWTRTTHGVPRERTGCRDPGAVPGRVGAVFGRVRAALGRVAEAGESGADVGGVGVVEFVQDGHG